jgi:hypothetical protein
MYNKSPILVFFILCILCFNGCKKDTSTGSTEHTYYISEAFKSWAIYKPGSYWIYLNEKTGKQDCTFVDSISTGIKGTGGFGSPPTQDHEWVNISMTGKLFSSFYIEASSTYQDFVSDNADLIISPYALDIGVINFSYYLLEYPIFFVNRYQEEIYNIGVKQVYPNETINGNSYSNSYDLRHEWLTSIGDSLVTEVHLVKNIGIIKFRVYREPYDTTWSLLRCNIVQ